MAEVQDDEQWLYGEDGEERTEVGLAVSEKCDKDETPKEKEEVPEPKIDTEKPVEEDKSQNEELIVENVDAEEAPKSDEEKENEKEAEDNDSSSSDEEATVTIGKIVKQPDIIRPPLPTHRAAPTSGLKDEDFATVGKINGIPSIDFNLSELEEKPWRKPGADLSDYFNYGFNENTWFKYCERQKSMRNSESGVGLSSLGIKPYQNTISCDLKKYPAKSYNVPPPTGAYNQNQTNSIQVMTADRRTYSNKVLNNIAGFDDMDFGGGNSYDAPHNGSSGGGENFFNNPPPLMGGGPFFNTPPPPPPSSWTPNVPPLSFSGPPPPVPPVVPPTTPYYEEGTEPPPEKARSEEREMDTSSRPTRTPRERDREARHQERNRDKDRERTSRRSRSHSRTRHTRRRSRSRSPSHRHKRKKSKRDRDERSKSR